MSPLASPTISCLPFEEHVRESDGTNGISAMMLPYLGHDITSYLWVILSWLTPNERDRIIKRSIEMSKQSGRMLLG